MIKKEKMEKVLKAARFAAQKHVNQRRKNKSQDPYINHPLEVAYFLSLAPGVEDYTVIAGILHDTIEDTNTTQEELEREFGIEVASIVSECTDNKSLPKVTRKKLQIEHAASPFMSYSATLVKLADKLSNLKNLLTDPPTSWSQEIIQGYVMWNYAVISQLSYRERPGVLFLRSQLNEVFSSFGIHSLDENILENYYNMIA
jgi:(p)ppGpp synthase/HD superfamily hydrolase